MRNMMKKALMLTACCSLLAGCASGLRYSSPVMAFAGSGCDEQADLSKAVSLEFPKKKKFNELLAPIAGNASCLTAEKGNVPYQLFALPAVREDRVFEVGSAVEPLRVFSPNIATLDANGAKVRHFAKDQFAFRGGVYSIQMRALDNEKYVLVTADPEPVGKYFDNIQTSTSTTSIYTGYGTASWTSGVDQNYTRAFSYEGAIVARVVDTSKEKN